MRVLLVLSAAATSSAFAPIAAPLHPRASCASRRRIDDIVAGRKGRPRVPQQYQQQQVPRNPEMPTDGMPLFYLYCRTSAKVMWYPVSVMKGDGQSKGLVNAWVNSPFGKGVFKNRLDEGMARSIFESERRLTDMAKKQYKSLKNQRILEWGYKVVQEELMAKEKAGEIEKVKIMPVSKDMVNDDSLIERGRKVLVKAANSL